MLVFWCLRLSSLLAALGFYVFDSAVWLECKVSGVFDSRVWSECKFSDVFDSRVWSECKVSGVLTIEFGRSVRFLVFSLSSLVGV